MSLGEYVSVNDIPELASYVAEKGPFDPNKTVRLIRNRDGQYSPDGKPTVDPENILDTAFWIDRDNLPFYTQNDWGVFSGPTATWVDFGGQQYIVWDGDYIPGKKTIYSITRNLPNGGGQEYQYYLDFPGDHPFLLTFTEGVYPPSNSTIE